MPDRCSDCSAPLPQTWTGPLRHCPACGSSVKKPGLTISDVKVERKPAAKKTTAKKTATKKKK